jgi:penicillin-binding protein 1A
MKIWIWQIYSIWRKARLVRYRGLVWYRKIANIFLTSIVLFLLYLFIVDINFLWLFGKSPSMRSISNPNQSVSILYLHFRWQSAG